jgi:hypothetical protein
MAIKKSTEVLSDINNQFNAWKPMNKFCLLHLWLILIERVFKTFPKIIISLNKAYPILRKNRKSIKNWKS